MRQNREIKSAIDSTLNDCALNEAAALLPLSALHDPG
jgi:hypothetical protein